MDNLDDDKIDVDGITDDGMFADDGTDDIDIDDSIFEKPQQTTFTEEEYNKMAKMMMEMNMKVQQKQPKGNVGKMREMTSLVENMKKFNRQRFSNATTSSSSSQQEKLAEENVEKEVVVEDVDIVIDSICELEFTE